MPDDELLDNGLSTLMRRSPRRPRERSVEGAGPDAAPALREPPPPTGGAAGDGAVRPGYLRGGIVITTTGRKKRVTVNLTEGVATVLRAAAAVGDDNGTAMNEIIEAVLVQQGYYPGGPRDPSGGPRR